MILLFFRCQLLYFQRRVLQFSAQHIIVCQFLKGLSPGSIQKAPVRKIQSKEVAALTSFLIERSQLPVLAERVWKGVRV